MKFKIKIKLAGCPLIFKEELGVGCIASEDVEFPDGKSTVQIAAGLLDLGEELRDKYVEIEIKEEK